ncbi:MAG: type II toxin-antitoxin system HigB family toxin [Ferruginibacter sp.]
MNFIIVTIDTGLIFFRYSKKYLEFINFINIVLIVSISYGTLKKFCLKYPVATDALNNWYRLTGAANWRNVHEMKEIFNAVDAVGNDRFVFNTRGNVLYCGDDFLI